MRMGICPFEKTSPLAIFYKLAKQTEIENLTSWSSENIFMDSISLWMDKGRKMGMSNEVLPRNWLVSSQLKFLHRARQPAAANSQPDENQVSQ